MADPPVRTGKVEVVLPEGSRDVNPVTAALAPAPVAKLKRQQAYYPDGRPVPDAELADALATGQARYAKGHPVSMRRGEERFDVPPEEVAENYRRGLVPETWDEKEIADIKAEPGWRATAHAAAGAFVDVGTLGAFPTLLSKEQKKEFERHAAALPTVTSQAQLLGAAATLPLGGPALRGGAALAKGVGAARVAAVLEGAPITASMLGRSGGTAVRWGLAGAVEGGSFDAGRELSRQALGNEAYSAEKILSAFGSGAGTGALVGGTLGGVGRVLGEGAVAGYRMARPQVAKGFAPPVGIGAAEWQAARSFGVTPEDVLSLSKKLNSVPAAAERINRFGREVLDRKLTSPLQSINERMKGGLKFRDEVGEAIGTRWEGLDVRRAEEGLEFNKLPVYSRVFSLLGELRKKGGKYHKIAAELQSDWGAPLLQAKSFKELHKLDSTIRKSIQKLGDDLTSSTVHQFRREVKEGLREMAATVDPAVAKEIRSLDELYSAVRPVMDKAEERALKGELRNSSPFTPWDVGIAGVSVLAGSPLGAAYAGIKGSVKWARTSERAAAGAALAIDKLREASIKQGELVSNNVRTAAFKGALHLARALPTKALSIHGDYMDQARAVREAAINPAVLARHAEPIIGPLANADPVVGRHAAKMISEDMAWLLSRLAPDFSPRRPAPMRKGRTDLKAYSNNITGQAPSQIAAFMRTTKILAEPVKVTEDLKKGKLAPEAAETLRERRPETLKAITQEYDIAVTDLAADGKVMEYGASIRASIVTGKPYHFTMEPDFIKMSQGVWEAKRAEAAQGPAAPPPRRSTTPDATRRRVREQLMTTGQEIMEPME